MVNVSPKTKSNFKRVKLEIAIGEVCDSKKFDQLLFWGRIQGEQFNYYVVLALKFKAQYEFPSKKFFYCSNKDYIFKELPPLITQFKDLIEEHNQLFSGNPEKILWKNE